MNNRLMDLLIHRFRIFDLRNSVGSDEAELWGGEGVVTNEK